MTKIDARTRLQATAQINESLTRLKTDHIDLLQHHEVLRYDDPDRIFNEGGSMEAVLAARQAAFQPMNEQQVATLISKSETVAINGKFELFKTTAHFDSTARHPDWLGADSTAVQQLAPQLPG